MLVSQLMALEIAQGSCSAGAVPGLLCEMAVVAGFALAVVTDGHRERGAHGSGPRGAVWIARAHGRLVAGWITLAPVSSFG